MLNIYQAEGASLVEQYFDLGRLFKQTINSSVASLKRRYSKRTQIRKMIAEKTWHNLVNKSVAKEFVDCLTAWAEGAAITPQHAMWLMADNLSGCQTAIVRYGSGMAVLHTEEDFDDMSLHMTGEKVVSISESSGKSCCLTYNDLMPGAGLYGWKKDLIVAVDTLFLREDRIVDVSTPMLANVVAWMIWRMKASEASPKHILAIVNELGELVDGYAINIGRRVGGVVEGYKLTLARDEQRVEYIGERAGDYLRQVNIIDPLYPKMRSALPPRNIWRGGYKYFLGRLATMDEHLLRYREITSQTIKPENLQQVHSDALRTIYTELGVSYINENVGAVCLGLLDATGTSVSCKLNDGQPFAQVDYWDSQK